MLARTLIPSTPATYAAISGVTSVRLVEKEKSVLFLL